jgi:hypothetical protein
MAHNGIEAVIDLAIRTARRRASREDTVLGLIAGLRRIRAALDEKGPTLASQLDATVRDVLIARNLGGREVPKPAPLPEPGPGMWFATTVLEDAAQTCLALNGHTQDNSAVQAAICLLADRLVGQLGGAPDIRRLYDRLWAKQADDDCGAGRESAVSLH